MKKSELIRQIENYLFVYTKLEIEELNEIAEGVLQICVDAGMKAPLTKSCPVLHRPIHCWANEEENSGPGMPGGNYVVEIYEE